MCELVDYSDSDKSESDISLSEYEEGSVKLSNSSNFQSLQSVHIAEEDFFNLKDNNDESNTNFWTSTIHDNDLLPNTVPMINKDDKLLSLQKDKYLEEENLLKIIDTSSSSRNHIETLNGNSNFLISYVIDYKASNIVDTNNTVIYPRLSLQWPYLALCGPLCKQSNETIDKLSSHILIWRLPYTDSAKNSPSLICDYRIHLDHELTSNSSSVLSPYLRLDSYCWTKFHSSITDSQCLQLIAATFKGLIEIWDINQGKKIRHFNVSSQTGPLLRCASLPVDNDSSFLLTGGISGIISLWDLRISTSKVPQLKYSHTELKTSIADLLWLNENQFSSCSDTVDRNNCEHNIAVWDIRFAKPISHQLYQERWGCNRLALKPKYHSNQNIRFAVQTHGDAIVEIYSKNSKKLTSSNRLSYHLEKRWRYEGHQIQAHPLGIAYNPSGNLLASGSWSSSSPVIWSTVHKIDSSYHLMTPMKLPGFRSSPKCMITDVVWIPNQYVSNGCDSIIGVQSNGTIIVYSSL
ncbi:unnamed protein product [Schistosoma rodhaini]|uniref:WD_REPEATS_REGION domain-containing protein n=2 Tax=Schistosoma rodhaini TaxID=6188 RepID=A0AA85GE96_9TREM|nr:unnamed protein product [Schistosoma rodhaini]CAH8648626.1 unnamed protein product [Schistosoma rodhaini]